jgi:hypothetical protein
LVTSAHGGLGGFGTPLLSLPLPPGAGESLLPSRMRLPGISAGAGPERERGKSGTNAVAVAFVTEGGPASSRGTFITAVLLWLSLDGPPPPLALPSDFAPNSAMAPQCPKGNSGLSRQRPRLSLPLGGPRPLPAVRVQTPSRGRLLCQNVRTRPSRGRGTPRVWLYFIGTEALATGLQAAWDSNPGRSWGAMWTHPLSGWGPSASHPCRFSRGFPAVCDTEWTPGGGCHPLLSDALGPPEMPGRGHVLAGCWPRTKAGGVRSAIHSLRSWYRLRPTLRWVLSRPLSLSPAPRARSSSAAPSD